MDVLRVREQSRAETLPDGSVVITSHPVVESPGGERFKTTAVTTIKPTANGGCQVLMRASDLTAVLLSSWAGSSLLTTGVCVCRFRRWRDARPLAPGGCRAQSRI